MKRFERFWSSDISLAVFLALLVGIVFILLPLAHYQESADLFANTAVSLLLLWGSLTVVARGWVRALVVLVASSTVAVRWAGVLVVGSALRPTEAVLMLLALALLLALILADVYREGRITRYRVMGAVAAYGLIGLLWTYMYLLIELAAPGSLQLPNPGGGVLNQRQMEADVVYFSFATLTTLGYGDIVPVHSFARSMAILEALIGQLFLATLIARLVAARGAPR